MKKVEFDNQQLENIFSIAEELLFAQNNIRWLNYNPSFTCSNKAEIINYVRNIPIVYCIWVLDASGPKPMYVGHSSSKYAKQRLTNHFIKKDPRTGSQLESIRQAVINGNKIGISYIDIRPDYMRKPVEDWIISKYREQLVWNNHGKII